MPGIEDYVRNPVTGQWEPPGTKLSGMPNAWDQPFDFTTPTPQGGQIINTPNSSTGQPFRTGPSAVQPEPAPTGNPLTTTPSSRTGAPAPGIRTLPIGGPLATATTLLAGGPSTDEDFYNQVGGASRWFDQTGFGKWLIDQGITSPTPRWGPPEARPSTVPDTGQSIKLGDGTSPIPVTYSGSGPGRSPSGPLPPLPPTGDGLPPFNSGPIPNNLPQGNVPYPPPRPSDLVGIKGGGGRGQRGQQQQAPGRAPPMINLQPGWTTIDRPNADIVGGPTRPGYLSADPHEPGGPARMGAFDLSTLWNPQAAAAPAAAAAPVRAGSTARRAPVRGPLGRGALGGQNQGQGQQAPGRMDPTIVAGGPGAMLRPSIMDPEIIARQRLLYGGQNPGDYGGYGAPA